MFAGGSKVVDVGCEVTSMRISVGFVTDVRTEVLLSPPLDVVSPAWRVLIVLVVRETAPVESVTGKTNSVALDPMPCNDVTTTTVLVMGIELEDVLPVV